MKQFLIIFCAFLMAGYATANGEPVKTDLLSGTPQYVRYEQTVNSFCLATEGKAATLCVSAADWEGVIRAAGDLVNDIRMVSHFREDRRVTLVLVGRRAGAQEPFAICCRGALCAAFAESEVSRHFHQ